MKRSPLFFSLLSLFSLLPMGMAKAQISPAATIQFVPPAAPERGRPPGRHQGGASRGSCHIASGPPLTAVIPLPAPETTDSTETASAEAVNSEATDIKMSIEGPLGRQRADVFSLTTQAHPSFWFYVPYSLETTPLEFVLQDEENNTLYQSGLYQNGLNQSGPSSAATEQLSTQLVSNGDRGIIQVTLPDSAPALQPETTYRWFFLAYCDEDDPSFVEGWVTRSSLSATADALADATPKEQAIFYAQNGIWQETLTIWGEHYKENMANTAVARDWESLLESANLGHLVEQPLMSCCSLE